MLEKVFQRVVIREAKLLLPDSLIFKTNPMYIQGLPDLVILNGQRWGLLEVKPDMNARVSPNQQYYIDWAKERSYGSFIYPENMEEVLDALQSSLRLDR